jgi:hypothetical protein
MKQRISMSLFLSIFTSQVVAAKQADKCLVVWLVYALALFPSLLALATYPHVKLVVEMHPLVAHVVVRTAQIDPATLLVADLAATVAGKAMMYVQVLSRPTYVATGIILV